MSMISIIVPIYNVEKYIRQCIDSICRQTYQDLEIILVDDGSTDACGHICEEYREKDSRVIVIHKDNGGLVSARKAGIRAASGQYIAYVDGDDWIEPDMYRRMYQKMTEQNVDVVMCGRYEDTGKSCKQVFQGIPEGKYDQRALLEEVYPRMIINGDFFTWGMFPGVWDKLFRRECVERFQLAVDERIVMGEDAACTYPCLLNIKSAYVMHACLYHYRQTTSSMVKKRHIGGLEREQFRILYRSVRAELAKYTDIYDLGPQWKKYMLFLMIPRADALYRGFNELDYLFPFPNVRRGTTIILYGAGTYGQRMYTFLDQTGFCKVAAWVDRNYVELQKMGLPVENPEIIPTVLYDELVVTIIYAKPRYALWKSLSEKYHEQRIHMIDEQLICSEETLAALGLNDRECGGNTIWNGGDFAGRYLE